MAFLRLSGRKVRKSLRLGKKLKTFWQGRWQKFWRSMLRRLLANWRECIDLHQIQTTREMLHEKYMLPVMIGN